MTTSTTSDTTLARWVIGLLTLVVLSAVGVLALATGDGRPESVGLVLPTINALLNASATLCLVAGLFFVKRGEFATHKRFMLTAFGLSCCFLITYLVHHARAGSVPFRGTGALRTFYFAILIPHIVLAAAVVPLALLTIYRGWTERLEAHRAVARIALPIWLYVSVSGVLVYILAYHVPISEVTTQPTRSSGSASAHTESTIKLANKSLSPSDGGSERVPR